MGKICGGGGGGFWFSGVPVGSAREKACIETEL